MRQIKDMNDLMGVITERPRYTSGIPVGIIAIDLEYPKLPGNVVNASTYDFPVMYEKVSFEIEELFRGDESIKQQVIDAAVKLEEEGAGVIIGACGFFAHFQEDVKEAVKVPVYLSSLCLLPMIRLGLKKGQKTAVVAASGESINDKMLSSVGGSMEDIVVFDVGSMESFAPIRWGKHTLENGKLTQDMRALGQRIRAEHPEIGAILLECSDLPPYAWAVQEGSGLPVYDFITLINWAERSVDQRPYYGII